MIFAEFLKSSDHYVTGQIEPKLPKALLLPQVKKFSENRRALSEDMCRISYLND